MSDNILNNDSGVVKPDIPNVPTINPNSPLPPFKAWVQMAIPTVYDESLSYAELLYKVINYLNVTNDHLTNNDNIIKELSDYMGKEVTVIQNWFNNLDVDDEVDRKVQEVLDLWALPYDSEIPDSGKLITIISPTIVTETDRWLGNKITQPTLNALDSSLLVSNAGANSKAVGDAIFGNDNTAEIRERIKSATPKIYNTFDGLTNLLNINKIEDMGYNTRVYVSVTSANKGRFTTFVTGNSTQAPITPVNGHNYCVSKYNIFISTSGNTIINILRIENLTTNEVVEGVHRTITTGGTTTSNTTWHNMTDATLMENYTGSDSKTVGDAIYREGNTVQLRPYLKNYGTLKYVFTSQANAISELAEIGVSSPKNMINGSYVGFIQNSSIPNVDRFLGDNKPTATMPNGSYIITKELAYGTISLICLKDITGSYEWYGSYDSSSSNDVIVWGANIGSTSINRTLVNNRTNFTPNVMGTYTPPTTPFDPWSMPENSIYYGTPRDWYENTDHNAYINLDRTLFELSSSESTPKELVNITYQLIRSKYGLEIICGYRKQFFYGNKAGSTQYWGTVGIENNVSINNRYEQTINTTEIINSGDINVTPRITTDTNNFLASTRDTTDRTADILAMLNTGCCILGTGKFYVHDLQMPDFSCLKGCGNRTEIVNVSGMTTGCIIKMGHNCTIENLKINAEGRSAANRFNPFYATGATGDDEKTIPDFSAILYSNTAHQYPLENINESKIANVTIVNCNGIGIKTINSTSDVDKNLIVVNCQMRDCICGIYNDINSEFHKFTNVIVTHCFYGAIIHGGNIVYTNCNFGACHMCVKLGADYGNNSHGIFNACLFVHSANIYGETPTSTGANNGYFIYALNITNGEKFIGCNFGFGKISIKSCSGLQIINSGIKTAKINVYGDTTNGASVATLFNGLTVNNVTLTFGEYASKTNIVNCFTSGGNPWNG